MAELPDYIVPPVIVDEEGMQQDAFDYIQGRWPLWVPNDSNLETWEIGAFARMTSEVAELSQDVPPAIYKFLGSSILGINPILASPAQVASTWTFIDNPTGRTIVPGTLVAIEGPDGDPIAFEVVNEVTVATPTLTTADGEVTLRAVEPGSDTNNLGGVGVVVIPLDPITWIDTITLTGATAGGADEETDEDYLDRLSARMTLLSQVPILPADYEVLARDLAAQEGFDIRALALDTYDPDTDTYDNERFVTTAVINNDGTDPDPALVTFLSDTLAAMREVNFVTPVIGPTRTTVDVTFTITATPDAVAADAAAAAVSAVTDFLSSANWGIPGGPDAGGWVQKDKLWRQDISTVINETPGVDHWDTLAIGLNGGAQTAAESFDLDTPAAVAEPGVIDGSVTP